MCGIAGFYAEQFAPDLKSQLAKARSALSHRGPDGSGCYVDEKNGVGFVHTRLAIQDL